MKGLHLRELRKKMKMSQSELADILEVSKRSIINYENSEDLTERVSSYVQYVLEKKNHIEIQKDGTLVPLSDQGDAHVPSAGMTKREVRHIVRSEVGEDFKKINEKIFSLMERIMSLSDKLNKKETQENKNNNKEVS